MGFEGQRVAHVGLFRENFSEEVALSLALKDVQTFTRRRGKGVAGGRTAGLAKRCDEGKNVWLIAGGGG